ncbi:hypothetical protein ABZS86_01455 [Streptomyces sp. NPDC005355]|uniref:hypothetical protein n=1 Tax=Streptomyces sp. NPDC005355 TaxID=3157038 RepID=UPI0033A11B75
METVITVVVILVMIAVGALLIHRTNILNGNHVSAEQHDDFPAGRHSRLGRWLHGRSHRSHRMTPPQDRRV